MSGLKKNTQKERSGFRNWLNELVKNEPVKTAYNNHLNGLGKESSGRPRDTGENDSNALYFLEGVIAEAFYQDAFVDYPNNIHFKDGGVFSSQGGSYYKTLLNSWEEKHVIEFQLPDFFNLSEQQDRFCWIEICSALQKVFHNNPVFKSVDDLNKFIISVGRSDDNAPLRAYGLYVRDINQLCLAYGILHGYSVAEILSLAKEAQACLRNAHILVEKIESANKTATLELKNKFRPLLSLRNGFELGTKRE